MMDGVVLISFSAPIMSKMKDDYGICIFGNTTATLGLVSLYALVL